MKTILEKQTEILYEEFDEWEDFKYKKNFLDNREYEIQTQRIIEDLSNKEDKTIDSVYFRWLLDLSILHFEYAIYSKLELKDENLAKKHLSLFCEYGFVCLEYGSKSCGCFESKNPYVVQSKAAFILSNLLLLKDTEMFNLVGKHLIDSLNGKSCIIKKGYKESTISWFILKLYSQYSKEEITLHKLLLPKVEFPYDEILENYDTKDLNEVNKYIEFLCDVHLSQAKFDYDVYEEEIEDGDIFHLKYKELFIVSLYFLPFEALYYLKLREELELENPKEFRHELMNTELSKMYLNIKEPLAKPSELPYSYELINKIKDNCQKLNKNITEEKNISTKKVVKNDLVPKTGKYRATLPAEHDQSEKLSYEPYSYNNFIKDEIFTYDGLEDYDKNNITWEFQE